MKPRRQPTTKDRSRKGDNLEARKKVATPRRPRRKPGTYMEEKRPEHYAG
jgi:hypothetical protein